MAFNPFTWFRKRQKVMFAALTILCMVTFVLCSGVAGSRDLFLDMFPEWLGQRTRSPQVTTLNGVTVRVHDLQQLKLERQIAAQVLQMAAQRGALTPELKEQFEQIQKMNLPEEQKRVFLQRLEQQIMFPAFEKMGKLVASGGTSSVDDLLDYKLWLQQADKLGIHLTPEGVDNLIREVAQVSASDLAEIKRGVRGNYGRMTEDHLNQALANELRAHLAQEALLGERPSLFGREASLSPTPGVATPYEFRDHLVQQRTVLDVALLAVPVKPAEVNATEQDLKEMRAFFNRYKDREPTPDSPVPGFKIPRRIAVEWVGAKSDDPYFRDKAARVGQIRNTLPQVLLAGTGGPLGGPTAAGVATALNLLTGPNPGLLAAYERLADKKGFGHSITIPGALDQAPLSQPGFALAILTSRPQPATVAATVAQLTGNTVTGASALAGVATYPSASSVRNARDMIPVVAKETTSRLAYEATAVLAGSAGPFPAAGVVYHAGETRRYLPFEAVRERLEFDPNLANVVFFAHLEEFEKELSKLRNDPKKAREWLAKAVAEYHLQHDAMKEPRDRYDILQSPALTPLKNAYAEANKTGDPKQERLADQLFALQNLYTPQSYAQDPKETFLYWMTENKPPEVPTFEAARAAVERAWRLAKGRPDARKQAEQLVKEVEAAKGDLQKLRQLAADKKLELIELLDQNGVTRKIPQQSPTPSGPRQYKEFTFPEKLEYPRTTGDDAWLDKLLALRHKGDAVLLANRPDTVYYVATLANQEEGKKARTEPDLKTFVDVYRDAANTAGRTDEMWSRLNTQRAEKYREAVLKTLREESKAKLTPDGKYDVAEEVRKDFRERGEDEAG